MKKNQLQLLIPALLCCSLLQAQLKFPINSSFQNDVQKVVAEFPNRFATLMGPVLENNPQTVEYTSTVKVEKAESCTVTRYSSGPRPVYSWQAVMLRTEDFEAAAQKYHWIYHQLKGLNVVYVVDQYTLTGTYEPPTEARKFSVSELTVIRPPEALRKLRIEVALQYEFPEWKVAVQIFERERADEERGEVYEK